MTIRVIVELRREEAQARRRRNCRASLARAEASRGEAAFRGAAQRRRAAAAILLACLLVAAWMSEAHPATLWAGLPRIGEYFSASSLRCAGTRCSRCGDRGQHRLLVLPAGPLGLLIFETANMAALATLMGHGDRAAAVLPGLAQPRRATMGLPARAASLEALRTVPEIVYALIFVWAFGVGRSPASWPSRSTPPGALGKLFAEVIENAGWRAVGRRARSPAATGPGCRFAILPQVLPNLLSYALLRFEINVRGASVIGFVGAGGIGEELYTVIAFNYYEEISAIVAADHPHRRLIDLSPNALRRRVIGRSVMA
jgi:phosphonate transport system permease protein